MSRLTAEIRRKAALDLIRDSAPTELWIKCCDEEQLTTEQLRHGVLKLLGTSDEQLTSIKKALNKKILDIPDRFTQGQISVNTGTVINLGPGERLQLTKPATKDQIRIFQKCALTIDRKPRQAFVPSPYSYSTPYLAELNKKQVADWKKANEAVKEAEKRLHELYAQVLTSLNALTTLKKADEVWPAVVPYLIKAGAGAGTGSNLPAIPTTTLNMVLGIPKPQAA